MLVYKATNDSSNLINTDISDIIKRTAERNSSKSLLIAFNSAMKASEYIKDNVSQSIAIGTLNIELMEELNIW
jgi:hypothetical protein